MPAAHGRENSSVIARLLAEPQHFEFFQAVCLALRWFGEHGVPPAQALARNLRFQNSLSLGFPASQIEALAFVKGEPEGTRPAGLDQAQIRITPAFMGFLGAHGALPAHVTERIAAWQSGEQDEAPRAFLDMLSNRMLALFYGAWRKYRVEHLVAEEPDRFLPMLLSLAGIAQPGEPGHVREEAIAFYAGLLQQRPISSVVLGRILSGYLGVPVQVHEAVDYWAVMTQHEQTSLGGPNAQLGNTALAGERSWRPDLRARLAIGPLSRDQYERFLPGRAASVALRKMLGLFAEPTVVYEAALVLRAEEVRPAVLTGSLGQGARLGQDSFVLDGPITSDRTDMRYDIRPMEPLPPLPAAKVTSAAARRMQSAAR
jgi:type VI secretion system protein ImpH